MLPSVTRTGCIYSLCLKLGPCAEPAPVPEQLRMMSCLLRHALLGARSLLAIGAAWTLSLQPAKAAYTTGAGADLQQGTYNPPGSIPPPVACGGVGSGSACNNSPGRIAFPNSSLTRDQLVNLVLNADNIQSASLATQDFTGFSGAANGQTITWSNGVTATIAAAVGGGSANFSNLAGTGTNFGRFPTSNPTYLAVDVPANAQSNFTIDFSGSPEPVFGFGFFVTDPNDQGGDLIFNLNTSNGATTPVELSNLTLLNSNLDAVTFPTVGQARPPGAVQNECIGTNFSNQCNAVGPGDGVNISEFSGSVAFVGGFTNSPFFDGNIESVTFTLTGAQQEFFGLDDFITVTGIPVPAPPAAAGLLMLFPLARLRKRYRALTSGSRSSNP